MAKIETIRDLVNAELSPKVKAPPTATVNISRLNIGKNRGAAAEFLGHKPLSQMKTPVSLRKKIEKQNSFVNPDAQFKTPTLLRNLGRDPQASVEVAEAHSTMSKAQVKAKFIEEELKISAKTPQQIIRETKKNNSFSKVPRTIQNLIK